jgi:lipopolysaccharide transport system ATP-binding protein
LGETSRQGKTVLIVSHSLPVITNFCHRAVLLESGSISAIGSAAEVVRQYMTKVRSASGEVTWPTLETAPGNDTIRFECRENPASRRRRYDGRC